MEIGPFAQPVYVSLGKAENRSISVPDDGRDYYVNGLLLPPGEYKYKPYNKIKIKEDQIPLGILLEISKASVEFAGTGSEDLDFDLEENQGDAYQNGFSDGLEAGYRKGAKDYYLKYNS